MLPRPWWKESIDLTKDRYELVKDEVISNRRQYEIVSRKKGLLKQNLHQLNIFFSF